MRRVNSGLTLLTFVAVAAGSVQAVNWDVVYNGDVMPDLAAPAWEHGAAGGASTLHTESGTNFLRVSNFNGSNYAPNVWKRVSDPYMTGALGAFEYNDPAIAGVNWVKDYRVGFTIEWRMRILDLSASIVAGDKVGVELLIPENGSDRVHLEMYYDKDLQCVRNTRYTWGAHAGLTGNEGAEIALGNDGFPNILPGVWHTYKVVHLKLNNSSKRHRELWLDGVYVGRWTDDTIVPVSNLPLVTMQADTGASHVAAVEFDYVRWANEPDGRYARPVAAGAAPTLLLNQSFDAPVGATQSWFGYYGDDTARAPAAPYQTVDGTGRWGNGRGEPGSENAKIRQTVKVPAGQTVTFNGYICAKGLNPGTGSTSVNVLTLYDGQTVTDPVIATATVTQATPTTLGQWVLVTLSGPCTSGHVTVQLDSTLNTVVDASAAYADGFTLTATGPTCAGQFTLTGISPASAPRGPVATVTIQGTNLDKATAVKLVHIANQTTVPCAIVSQAANQMSISVPTTGQNLAKYNLVVEGPNCAPQQLVEAFEIICSNATTVTGMVPAAVTLPQGALQFTITGTGLNPATTSFKLVLGETEILGSNAQMSGNDLLVTFDLTSATAGYYDLVGESSDPCGVPPRIIAALEYLPVVGGQLLQNGDFETGSISPWQGGCLTDSMPFAGAGPHSGTYFLGASANGSATNCVAEQTVMPPNGPGNYDLTLAFWAWVYDFGTNEEGYDSYVTGEIIVDGAPVASITVSTLNRPMQAYIPAAVRWSGSADVSITARITLRADGRDKYGPYQYWGVVAADDVRLSLSGPFCNNPFADADADGDVDHVDFGMLQACYTGIFSGLIPTDPVYCACFNRPEGEPAVWDEDIDSVDMAAFTACVSGPEILADKNCDGAP